MCPSLSAACTIANSNNVAVKCSTPLNSQANFTNAFGCNPGFYPVDNEPPTADVCLPCAQIANSNGVGVTCSSITTPVGNESAGFQCSPGYWHSAVAVPHVCVPCTGIANSNNETLYCSNATDSRGKLTGTFACLASYYPSQSMPGASLDPDGCVGMRRPYLSSLCQQSPKGIGMGGDQSAEMRWAAHELHELHPLLPTPHEHINWFYLFLINQ